MRRLFLLAFIWGWSFLFIKVAVEGLTPSTVAWARITLGAAVLHLYLRSRGLSLPRGRACWRHFAFAGLVGSAVPFTMLAWGEERITSALTAVLNASTPLFTAVAAVALLRDRLRFGQVAGLLLGLAGVAVAAGVGGSDLEGSSVSGSLASVGAGACYGLAFAYMRKHLVGIRPEVAAAGQLTVAAVVLAPIALITSIDDGAEISAVRALCVVLLGVVGTGIAYVLNYQIIADLGATKASLVTYVIPVVAVLVGVLVLDERFELRLIAGGLMIVLAIALVHRLGLRRPRPAMVGPAVLLPLLALLVACGDSGSDSIGCSRSIREALDPQHLVHALPSAPEPDYTSDPPTSGAHQPSPQLPDVVDEPITRPVQVGVLEAGNVLVQYRPDVAAPDRAALIELAGDGIIVAPQPDLPEPIVATAWLHKLSCDGVDVTALRSFADARLGKGPDGEASSG